MIITWLCLVNQINHNTGNLHPFWHLFHLYGSHRGSLFPQKLRFVLQKHGFIFAETWVYFAGMNPCFCKMNLGFWGSVASVHIPKSIPRIVFSLLFLTISFWVLIWFQLCRISVSLNYGFAFYWQQHYSLLGRTCEFEPFEVCKNEGVGVLPYSPLNG